MPERPPQGLCPACLLGWVINDRVDPGTRVRYFGDYEVRGVLGSGAMGVVYEARQVSLNRTVALKMIRAGALARDEELRRFQNEAKAIARLDHPHIVPIHEVGEHEGKRYFSMKLIVGPCLSQSLCSYTTNPLNAARLMVTIVEAVHHAHQRGILHRDLKPSNILLDENGQPHVSDFGLAKQVEDDASLTETGAVLGTPAYMAPEQAAGKSSLVTTLSDVYGLGAVLYAVLAGKPPFDGDSALETLDLVRHQQPVSPSRINPKVPRDLEVICLKCLEKHPDRRYPSAQALADELRRFLAGRPIQARPVSSFGKGFRWCRRRPLVAALSAALVLAVLGGLIGTSLALLAAVNARQEAIDRERDFLKARAKVRELTKLGGQNLQHELALQGKERDLAALSRVAMAKKPAPAARSSEPADLAERRRYNDRMNLLDRYWESGQMMLVRRALADEAPTKPGAIDRRGFEWFYWQRRVFSPPISTLRGHTGGVDCVAFSPDGKQIASASFDRTVKIWDVATGKTSLTLEGHTRRVESVAFSPDGKRIASASADQTVKVWDTGSGREALTLAGHTDEVTAVAFSPDGRSLATASRDRTIKLWDSATGQETRTLKGHRDEVTSVAFSPDGKRIASASRDETARLWDLPSGQEIRALTAHSGWVLSVAFSPDGKRIASAGSDQSVKLWDSGTLQQTLTLEGRNGSVMSVVFSPDGRRIASGASDGTGNVWDITTRQVTLTFKGHESPATGVAFSPDGERIACASWDKTVTLWRAANGRETLSWKAHNEPVSSMAFSSDGNELATASRDNMVKLWDAATGKEAHTLKGHTDWVVGVAFSPDGTRLASGSDDQTVKLWDAETGQETHTLKGHTDRVSYVAFSPDSRRLASASWDKTIKVWDTQTGQELFTFKRHAGKVTCLVFHPDGKQLASCGWDETVKVWDTATGQETRTIDCHLHAETLGFSADGKRIAFAGVRETFGVLQDTDGGKVVLTLRGHIDSVASVAISPDGRRLASGSNDRTVKVWDTATGQETLTLKGHESPVIHVAFSPDGQRLASASSDQTVKVWDARPMDTDPATPERRSLWKQRPRDPFNYIPE
jgi:eukaryotic-like serine/threonine-protein kinase